MSTAQALVSEICFPIYLNIRYIGKNISETSGCSLQGRIQPFKKGVQTRDKWDVAATTIFLYSKALIVSIYGVLTPGPPPILPLVYK